MQRLPSPDRSLRKPGLFVIGAMKSGTSYLSRLLGLHPSIFIPDLEEPSYFVPPGQLRDIWPYMWDQGIWRSEEAYLRLFQPGGDATILGEASTNYSKVPLVSGVPERIARFNDEARFIYIMRDPVERSISHYWHMVRFNAEYRPMLSAILQDPRYMAVSHYARQLAPYFSLFGRERVFTLTFEELVRDTESAMQRIYGWLGLDPFVAAPTASVCAENVTPDVVAQPSFFGLAHRLRIFTPLRTITPYLPIAIRGAAKRLTSVRVARRTIDATSVVDFLRPIQRRQSQELIDMIGRDFPEWTTLFESSAPISALSIQNESSTHA
jgi:hypothetical protein